MRIRFNKKSNFRPHGDKYFIDYVAYYCPTCGSVLYGIWNREQPSEYLNDNCLTESQRKEYWAFKRRNVCSLCGGELRNDDFEPEWSLGYNVYKMSVSQGPIEEVSYSSISKSLELFEKRKTEDERDFLIEAANKNCAEWDVPATSSPLPAASAIKSDPGALKAYLLKLVNLETNVYALTEMLGPLYFTRLKAKQAVIREEAIATSSYKDALTHAQERLQAVKNTPISIQRVLYPREPVPPVLAKPGLFNKAKVLAANDILTKRYEEELEDYRRKTEACKEKEARLKEAAENSAKAAEEEAEAAVIDAQKALEKAIADAQASDSPVHTVYASFEKEVIDTERLLQETLKCRNELYNLGIIFGKYCDFVAVSTFYEYLMAGRCTSLEGSGGAYNIYEKEIRADKIISQLDTVIEELEDIKKNQYTLYSQLTEVNRSLSSLNDKMDQALAALDGIEHQAELIAYNTAATAYYAKKNAELTDALGFMVALK